MACATLDVGEVSLESADQTYASTKYVPGRLPQAQVRWDEFRIQGKMTRCGRSFVLSKSRV